MSLSSWRAWIEILDGVLSHISNACRSPHGERGLKYGDFLRKNIDGAVALLMESVD